MPPNAFHPVTVNAVVVEEKQMIDSGQSNVLFLLLLLRTEYLCEWFIGLTQQGIACELL